MHHDKLPTIGFVGAGLSALSAAVVLSRAGFSIRLFEKSRGPGGRMATRREGPYGFDHGAQYFTARDKCFVQEVQKWVAAGKVQRWEGRIGRLNEGRFQLQSKEQDRFVGVPHMSSIGRHLAEGLDVRYNTCIGQIERGEKSWYLLSDRERHRCDIVLISTPPRQALDLLPRDSSLGSIFSQVELSPCWALMVVFEHSLDLCFDGAFVQDAPLSWVARNSSKVGRGSAECWVLHASPEWSTAHLQMESEVVADVLIDAFFRAAGSARVEPLFVKAHRWRYSIAEAPLKCGSLWNAEERIGLCGDWCNSLRVEGAFLSGIDLAERIIAIGGGTPL